MHLHQIIAIIRRLLGSRAEHWHVALSHRACRSGRRSFYSCCASFSLASASVLVTGDVTPTDNPFPLANGTNPDEGLPGSGNKVNPFECTDRSRPFLKVAIWTMTCPDLTDDTNVNITEIIVGKTSQGQVLISGGWRLRDQNLIIGDQGTLGGVVRFGTGIVRITGFGSLYNSDPLILPGAVQNVRLCESNSAASSGADGNGNDLYVGRAGTGTLEISAGASR